MVFSAYPARGPGQTQDMDNRDISNEPDWCKFDVNVQKSKK